MIKFKSLNRSVDFIKILRKKKINTKGLMVTKGAKNAIESAGGKVED